jgi:methylenetetrahydrofolate dehydrogenase (NADP+)/methenyltetrahydrofolate cyclohydrolase
MTARVIDGKQIAEQTRAQAAEGARKLLQDTGVVPQLAAVLVGDDPASAVYVRNKQIACQKAGFKSTLHRLAATATQSELMALVESLNADPDVHGILVQLPLPKGLDATAILDAILPSKDVDGFHAENVGLMSQGRPRFLPCTPAGVMRMLKVSGIATSGTHAVVIGRSDIVGKPMAMLLINANATVTVCHSKTRDLAAVCRRADILVAAIGRAGMITRDFVRPGATVVDVGTNKVTDRAEFERFFKGNEKREQAFAKNGSTLVGDVHPEVAEVAGAITPVPGGVGPLTIAMLMANTVRAAKLRRGAAVAIG